MTTYTYSNHHIPVLEKEVYEMLHMQEDGIFVDATIGNGGHARYVGNQLSRKGILIGLDLDRTALQSAQENLKNLTCVQYLVQESYARIDTVLDTCKIKEVDAILIDCGLRMDQIIEKGRGFSFRNEDDPLIMSFSYDATSGFVSESGLTAQDILATYSKDDLTKILKEYGDIHIAEKISEALCRVRGTIKTVRDLNCVIDPYMPRFFKKRNHEVAKLYQALRIEVNQEFRVLHDGVKSALKRLSKGGVLAVITFHSGEDRFIKQTFKLFVEEGGFELVNKKAIKPHYEEVKKNRASRSSVLRGIRKVN